MMIKDSLLWSIHIVKRVIFGQILTILGNKYLNLSFITQKGTPLRKGATTGVGGGGGPDPQLSGGPQLLIQRFCRGSTVKPAE